MGLHYGNVHRADLGDGDGRKDEQFLAGQYYFPVWGTCWESVAGEYPNIRSLLIPRLGRILWLFILLWIRDGMLHFFPVVSFYCASDASRLQPRC